MESTLPGPGNPPPRLLDQLRGELRTRHYSLRTEDAYVDWTRRFILFHGKRHPREMGAAEVQAFLSHLAVERHVSPSTQNQALAALLFLYRNLLEVDLPWLSEVVQARRPPRLPVVLTPGEVRALFDQIIGVLIEDIEGKALAELSIRLAPVPNAPPGVVVKLARNDDIAVAGPMLKQASIPEPELKFIAETKSQTHLLAMSVRRGISEGVSEVLVQRGDDCVSGNAHKEPHRARVWWL